jgi:hypothetical protein
MADFPSTLPAPLAEDYAINPEDGVIRTNFEVGAGRSRRRTTSTIDEVPVVWVFSSDQFAAFRTWFDSSAGADGGGAWFNTTLLTGYSSTAVTARFASMWSSALVAGKTKIKVSATLQVRYA